MKLQTKIDTERRRRGDADVIFRSPPPISAGADQKHSALSNSDGRIHCSVARNRSQRMCTYSRTEIVLLLLKEQSTHGDEDEKNSCSHNSAQVDELNFTDIIPYSDFNEVWIKRSRAGRFGGDWTDMMYARFHKYVPTCSLVFTYNHVRKESSRKSSACFWRGKAACKRPNCLRVTFEIRVQPNKAEDVVLDIAVIGRCNHAARSGGYSDDDDDDETDNKLHKRFLTGTRRQKVVQEMSQTGIKATPLYFKELADMNEEELAAGMSTSTLYIA